MRHKTMRNGRRGFAPGSRKRVPRLAFVATAALAAVTGLGLFLALGHPSAGSPSPASARPGGTPGSDAARPGLPNERAVTSRVEPGVVDLDATLGYSGAASAGTGIIVSASGLVLTNNHVIDQATKVTARLASTGQSYAVRILGYDAGADVALLQLQHAAGLKPVTIGNSAALTIGAPLVAMGNANGEGGAPDVTTGTVTGLDKSVSPYDEVTGIQEELRGMIQTNAGIYQGDSGGPLADAAGQVVGMITAGGSGEISNRPSITASYAIGMNVADAIVRRIAAGQASAAISIGVPGSLGVSAGNAGNLACQGEAGSGYRPPVSAGALVCQVLPGTPAQAAGMSAGDVIVAVDGKPVASVSALDDATAGLPPGTRVRVGYVDAGHHRHAVALTLVTGPAG